MDVVLRARAGELAAHDTRIAGDEDNAERERHVLPPAAEQAHEHEQNENARKGGERVVQTHEHLVHPAAVPAGQRADERAYHGADGDGTERDEQRVARADHDAAENVAPEFVRAHQVRGGRRQQA